MPETAAPHAVLDLAFLVHREEVRPGSHVWFARSVLTSTAAHGTTPEAAIARLEEALGVALEAAGKLGTPGREWLRSARPDDERYVVEFCRRSLGPLPVREHVADRAGCRLRAKVATVLPARD